MVKRFAAALAALALWAAGAAIAQPATNPSPTPPAPVRVIAFDGGWNLPVWAAQRQGYFEANGVAVQIAYTPNSGFLVSSLFDGRYDLALALVDNLVAYQEGQGEAKIPDNPDLVGVHGRRRRLPVGRRAARRSSRSPISRARRCRSTR